MDIQQVNTVLAMRKAQLAAGTISQAQALEPITGDEARLAAAARSVKQQTPEAATALLAAAETVVADEKAAAEVERARIDAENKARLDAAKAEPKPEPVEPEPEPVEPAPLEGGI